MKDCVHNIGLVSPRFRLGLLACVSACCLWSGCGGGDKKSDPTGLPKKLPFSLTRPDVGEPLTDAEVRDFTARYTGFLKEVDYFRWASWHSHGFDASANPSAPDFKLWWQDTSAMRSADTVTFQHHGGADNLLMRTVKVMNQAISGYLLTGDQVMARLAEQYCKGITALFLGMVWGDEDPLDEPIMARAIFVQDHSYVTDDGRKVEVDYGPAKEEKYDWNAQTIPNATNPHWGEIWVRNMRSKDDVPYLFGSVDLLLRVINEGDDDDLRQAAQTAHDLIVAMGRDIAEHDYQIRTKDQDGNVFVPDADLASFVAFEGILPNAECNAKLTSALVGLDESHGNDCGSGIQELYESLATGIHFFNYDIIRFFHLSAIVNALLDRENEMAEDLLIGLVERTDVAMDDEEHPLEYVDWYGELAHYLISSAASGLPLTSREARFLQQHYMDAIDHYSGWPFWDLWDASVPEGEWLDETPNHRTDERGFVRAEELAHFFHYCYSPWRNPAGVVPIDCSVLAAPNRWGTPD